MKFSILLLSFLTSFSISCNNCTPQYNYTIPDQLSDGIEVGHLKSANLDTSLIVKALDEITCGKFGEVHSMLIYKDGVLLLEEYFQGHNYQWNAANYHGELIDWDYDQRHNIMSCTKNFTSTCIGIAIEEGFIESVNQSIFDYLPDHQFLKDNNKENISIEHLLTMTSGLEWDEWAAAHGTSANDVDRLYFECSDDPIKCVLERDLVNTPGEDFTYNGGGFMILGEILKNASNMNIDEFSMKYLFDPLGIDSTLWYQFENGLIASDGSLQITPRDMLKLGALYLNKGVWNGNRILSDDWVTKSSIIYKNNKGINIPIEDSGRNGYAYSWWLSELSFSGGEMKMFRAGGWGGQSIMVIPELNLVVVFTGGNYNANSKLFKILEKYILPSIKQEDIKHS